MTTIQLIRSDLREMYRAQGSWLYVAHPAVIACVLYRLAHAASGRGTLGRLTSQVLSLTSTLITGSEIHAKAVIGPGLRIPHATGIGVGAGVVAGEKLTLYQGTVLGAPGLKPEFPSVGDRVTLGAKASVIGVVHVGDDVYVGAHALVISDIPDGHVAVGVPARSVMQLRDE